MSAASDSAALRPDAVADLARTRRSPARFDASVAVDPDLLRSALDAATFAPNHKRTEPWRFYVLGPESRAALIDLNATVFAERQGEEIGEARRRAWSEIPAFVVVTQRTAGDAMREKEDYAAIACAVQTLSLVLHAGGIGVRWTTGPVTRDPRLAGRIGFDAAEESVAALLHIGAPAADLPARPPRKGIDEVARWCP